MKLLVLTHRLPFAPDRGDRIRAFHLLKQLAGAHDVHLLSLVHDDDEEAQVAEMKRWLTAVAAVRVPRTRNLVRGVLSLTGARPLTYTLLDAPGLGAAADDLAARAHPELIVAYCSGIAPLAMRPALCAVPCLLDMVDVDSRKWAALARTTRRPLGWVYWRESRLLATSEARLMRHARVTTVINAREREAALDIAPDADVHVVGNGVDVAAFAPPGPPLSSPQVVFCGVMSYQPNAETAEWLAARVWPIVRRTRPDARLALVGAEPGDRLRRLGSADASIIVTGRVPDVRPFLWESAVAAAPIRTARGLQNKVLEAVAAGLPAIVSPAVFEGLPASVHPACTVVRSDEECASAILEALASTPEARRAHAARADLSGLTWERQMAPMLGLIDQSVVVRR